MLRLGISGSYGGLNLGDEAILEAILAELRDRVTAEFTVFSRNPSDTRKRHAVVRALPVRELSREEILPEIERLDLLILGGGGILFDAEARLFLREVSLALELGIPVMVYAIGAGPLHDPGVQRFVRNTLNGVSVLSVRERSARQVLEEIGVEHEIRVTADPALLLRPEPLPAGALEGEGLAGARRRVGLSVREPGAAAPDIDETVYQALLANAADFIVDRFDADIVFVPMERTARDVQHAHAVIAQMLRAQRATVLKGEYTSGQLLSLMQCFDFAVGMRLHFLMFAALQGVPFVALPYAAKVGGFLDDLGIRTPPLELVNAGRLIAHIDQSWDRRRSLQTRIRRALPALLIRARENSRLALELLEASRPGAVQAGG